MNKAIFIAPTASIYGDVSLGENSNVWFNVSIRGDINKIEIGENTNIQDNSVIHVDFEYSTRIGSNVTIGHSCIIHGCEIADNVLVGMGTTILNGASIGKNTIIGAGSLVTQNKAFLENSLIMGRPAKFVRYLTGEEIESIKQNADNYVSNALKYKNGAFLQIK